MLSTGLRRLEPALPLSEIYLVFSFLNRLLPSEEPGGKCPNPLYETGLPRGLAMVPRRGGALGPFRCRQMRYDLFAK